MIIDYNSTVFQTIKIINFFSSIFNINAGKNYEYRSGA